MDPAPKRPARWLDRLTTLALVGAVGGAAAAGAPSVLRAAGLLPEPSVAAPPRPAAHPTSSPETPSPGILRASDENPRFLLDEEPTVTELERMYPDGMWPGRHKRPAAEDAPASKPRAARTSAALTLRERGDPGAAVTGRVPAGERVMVVRERDGWVLVVHQHDDGISMGWAPKTALAIP